MAKTKTFYRSAFFTEDSIDVESRTVRLSFSSEEPYERYNTRYNGNYFEVLGHSDSEVDLSFLNSGRAPLLRDHKADSQIGVVSSVDVSSGRGEAVVRLSQNEDGQAELRDIVDGIRVNVSVGYYIEQEEVVGERDGRKIVRATRWRPIEISTVSIPADETVGIGRGADDEETTPIKTPEMAEETTMTIETNVDLEQVKAEARKAEQARVREITQLGAKFGLSREADSAIRGDTDVEAFRAAVLEKIDLNTKATAVAAQTSSVELSKKEERAYSFMNVVKAQMDPSFAKKAGLEIEVSRALAEEMGIEAKGIMVPHSLMVRAPLGATATHGSSNGANIVETSLGSFIDLLRNRMVTAQAGATILSGLRGNLALPKANVGATAYWVNEVTGVSASDPKMTQVTLTPKTLGTYVDATRQLVLQGSLDVENYLRNDLVKTPSVELDRVGLYGNTSLSQPKGIVFQTGVDVSVAFAVAATPTWANVHSMIAAVETDNALEGSLAFIVAPGVRAKAATTSVDSGSGRFVMENGQIAGYRVISSNQITAGDAFFGDFSSLIYGLWGGLDVVVDTAALATSGGIRVIALQSADVAVKYGESFAYAK